MGSSVYGYTVLIQVALLMLRRHDSFCDKMAPRYRAELGLKRARDLGHRALNLIDHRRTLAFEPLFHLLRRLRDQLLEKMPGDVLAETKLLAENGIAFGPLDHVQKAEIRKTRSSVICDRVHDLPIAARYEHVCDRLLDRPSF